MKKYLIPLLAFFFIVGMAKAVTILPVQQGGTGFGFPGNITPGAILFGNYGGVNLATSSNLVFSTTTNTLTTQNIVINGTCTGSGCGSGGGGGTGVATTSLLATYPITVTKTTASITFGWGGLGTTSPFSNNQFVYTNPSGVLVTAASSSLSLPNASLQNSSITVNGTIFNLGDTHTIFAASSTLLANNNTFSGTNIFNSTITGSVSGNAGTATALQTGRTIAITGDLAYTSASFDGSGNVTGAGTLATVNSNVGSFTNANITVNGKGLITAASNGTGGSGTGLSTTSPIAAGNLLEYSSTGAGSAFGVATSTLSASGPLTGSFTQVGSGGSLGCTTASAGVAGCLNSSDWSTFNNKLSAAITSIGTGYATTTGPGVSFGTSTVNNSTNAHTFTQSGLGLLLTTSILSSPSNSSSIVGMLNGADWNTFNGKQAAGNYITALTGDVTASGPGSVAGTLATVNSNVGSFTNANITVNGKGLITAASNGTAPVTSVTATYPILSTGGATPVISTAFGTTTTWGMGNNGFVITGATGIPFTAASSSLNLPNTALQNSSITLNGSAVSLGGSATISSTTLLANNNTFTGINLFTNASSDFSGTWQTFLPSHFQTALGFTAVPTTRAINTTYPLQGGGDLSADRTITFAGLSTTSPWTQSSLAYVVNGNTVASVATGTISAGSSAITVTTGRAAIGGALAIDCATAGSGQNGCLSSTDWSTFNGKLSGNQSITLSGVVTGSGATAITTAFGSQSAGVLGNPATGNTAVQATSTLYGAVQNGKLLGGVNGTLQYVATTTAGTGLTYNAGTPGSFSVNTTQSISALSNLSTNALVVTGGGNGTLAAYGGASACSSNNFVTTISALGATTCGTASISGVNLGSNLNNLSTNSSLTGTSYNGSATVSNWGINLANSNTWTAGQTFNGQINLFTASNALVGIGTSTPFASLSIATTSANAVVVSDAFNTPAFQINTSSTTGSIFTVEATTTSNAQFFGGTGIKLFDIDQYGHMTASSTGATPTLGTCTGGATFGANANDTTGDVTLTTAVTSCAIVFAHAYSATPEVFLNGASTVSFPAVTAVSTTGFTIGVGAAVTGDKISYFVVIP